MTIGQPTLKLSSDYFYLGPAQVTDQPGSFCETTLTDHTTNLLLKLSRDYFYLGPAPVTDQPTLKLSRDYFYLGLAQ